MRWMCDSASAHLTVFPRMSAFIEHAECQTAMTHNHPQVIESARFFAITAVETLGGLEPVAAIEEAVKKMPPGSSVSQKVILGLEAIPQRWMEEMNAFSKIKAMVGL